jgi:hypothetical protein
MEAVAANAGTLTGPALIRAETALACARPPLELDRPGTEQRLAEYAGRAGVKLV